MVPTTPPALEVKTWMAAVPEPVKSRTVSVRALARMPVDDLALMAAAMSRAESPVVVVMVSEPPGPFNVTVPPDETATPEIAAPVPAPEAANERVSLPT